MKQYNRVLFAFGHSIRLFIFSSSLNRSVSTFIFFYAQFDVGNNRGTLTVANVFSEFSVDAEVQSLSWQPELELIFASTRNRVMTSTTFCYQILVNNEKVFLFICRFTKSL